jgi:hypothetical protein
VLGYGSTQLAIEPSITNTVASGGSTDVVSGYVIYAYNYYGMRTAAVAGAAVTFVDTIGSIFNVTSVLTDSQGYFSASFTLPSITATSDDIIMVSASEPGYSGSSSALYIEATPGSGRAVPDIMQVVPSKTVVGQSYSVTVNVIVMNLGNSSETFNVTLYANAIVIGSENVTLPAGSPTTVTFTWNTNGFAYGNYTISAYALPTPGETNTGNSNLTGGAVTVTIPGDVDGNGRVNMNDIVSILKAFGSTPGQPNWNPNCDIDGEGRVDMSDVVIAVSNFGQHYP